MSPKITDKKKISALLTKVDNKLNKNKGLQCFIVTYIKHSS